MDIPTATLASDLLKEINDLTATISAYQFEVGSSSVVLSGSITVHNPVENGAKTLPLPKMSPARSASFLNSLLTLLSNRLTMASSQLSDL